MPADSEFAIDCHDLVIDRIGHGGTTRAVDGVTFSLRPGELMCIGGATGAGKSTLVTALAGMGDASLKVAGGRATVCGVNIRRPGRARRTLTALTGHLAQAAGAALPPRLTVAEAISEPITSREKKVNGRALAIRAVDLGNKGIKHANGVAALQQLARDEAADEACAAGNQDGLAHFAPLWCRCGQQVAAGAFDM